MSTPRDHGGGLDAAIARYGGPRADWLDLSTGINPVAYPHAALPDAAWNSLPDSAAQAALENAARAFWRVPGAAAVLAAPGASALIARLPYLRGAGNVRIDTPTYNEHAAAFEAAGWRRTKSAASVRVIVSPNNPTGHYWDGRDTPARPRALLVIDESFCEFDPARSHIAKTATPGVVILKSFGKFWGLAGLRLGFAIGDPADIAALRDMLGPWPVSGPALAIGALALQDKIWAAQTRTRLHADARRLDAMLGGAGARLLGGTPLFRLYQTDDAARWQDRLARHRIWSRIFPYSKTWLRLGLPAPARWDQVKGAL